MGSTGKIKPKAVRVVEKVKKPATPAERKWLIGGAVALAIVIAWFIFASAKRETPTHSLVQTQKTRLDQNVQTPESSPSSNSAMQEQSHAFIKAVRLQPSQPTRMDTVKVEIEPAPDAPKQIVYSYVWKLNDRIIEGARGDTLNLSDFKKGDIVSVTVAPNDGSIDGYPVSSPLVAIHSIPLSLELQAMRLARKNGAPIELQLVSIAPESEQVTFSLEPPLVPGMTIDKRSGKITWVLQPDQKGTVRFGAAVEDDNRMKVTKNFEVKVD
jgi:hypothetical protein